MIDFSNFHPKTVSNLYTFLAVDLVRHVTTQVGMGDSHFLLLDAACTFIISCFL